MFAYCGNNPVNNLDSTGRYYCKVCFNAFEPFDSALVNVTGGAGGGGGINAAGYLSKLTESRQYEGTLHDTVHSNGIITTHGKFVPWEFSMLTFNSEGISLIDASIALMEAVYETPIADISVLRAFSLDISAGITREDGLHVDAMASIASASAAIYLGPVTIDVAGYLGAIGVVAGVAPDSFAIGISKGVGLSFSVKFDV